MINDNEHKAVKPDQLRRLVRLAASFLIRGLVGTEGLTGRERSAQATKHNWPGAMSADLTTPQPFRLPVRLEWKSLRDAGIRNKQDLRIIQTCLAGRLKP